MSGNTEEEKSESGKIVPLDLARNQMTTVKTIEGKTPIVMTGQHLRGMRVLTQSVSTGASGQTSLATPTIITTNILPPAVLKQGKVSNIRAYFKWRRITPLLF